MRKNLSQGERGGSRVAGRANSVMSPAVKKFHTGLYMSRRRMVQLSAGMAALALQNDACARQQSTAERGCTLGFSTYGMKDFATEEALRTIAKIGFDSVELTVRSGWDADSARLPMGRRRSLQMLLDDLPLRLVSLMEHVFPTDAQQQAIAMTRLKMAAELAHDLSPKSPPLIQTVLGGGSFDNAKSQLRDRLADWAELADATDTTIAIKPHRGGVVSRPSEAAWLIEQLGRPHGLRMVYDYSHYAYRDLSLAATIETALPHTAHVAVKDAVRTENGIMFKLPGEAGTIDFVQLLRQFHAGGYRRDFNCEVSGMIWSQPKYDPVEAAKTCHANMSAAFRAAGIPRAT